MTPREKAKELVSKINGIESEQPCFIISVSQSKKAALIAVEELIKEEEMFQNGELNPTKYWKLVKEEINKL